MTFSIYVTAFDCTEFFQVKYCKIFITFLIPTTLFAFYYEMDSDRLLSTSHPVYIYIYIFNYLSVLFTPFQPLLFHVT